MLSIKLLNIAMVLSGILLTGFLCTYLAVTSGDDALGKTKDSRRESVDNAFDVGTRSVENMTLELLNEVRSSTSKYVEAFLDPHVIAAKSVAGVFLAKNASETHRYSFFGELNSVTWNLFHNANKRGMTALGFSLDNRGGLMMYEDEVTVARPPNEFHYYGVLWNTGENTGSAVPGGLDRSMRSDVIPYTGQPLGVPHNTDTNINWNYPCRESAIATDGAVPDEPCMFPLDTKGAFYPLANFILSGEAKWSHPVAVGYYVIIACIASFAHSDWPTYPLPSGMSYAMLDLRQISSFLAELEIGEYGRVYTMTRGNWLDSRDVGAVTGVSRGRAFKTISQGVIETMTPRESDDGVIKGTAGYLEGAGYEAVYLNDSLAQFDIETDRRENDTFFARVGVIKTAEDLNWYVVTVIDREYILGDIDANIEKTHQDIQDSEASAQSDLDNARVNLFVIVAVVTLCLIILSVLLVFAITSPLSHLQQEMALVAVMKLDSVSPPKGISTLSEVASMQTSFQAMLRNLKEYRNFIPAAALQENSDDDDTQVETSNNSGGSQTQTVSCSQTGSRVSSGGYTHSVKQAALQSDVRNKKITLASVNLIQFLECDLHKKLSIHGKYLSACLSCTKECKGIPDGFSGDRFLVSFNAAKQCAGHRSSGFIFGSELQKHAKQLKLSIAVAVTSGDTPCGNMGVETMKKYTYIGSLSSWLYTMQQLVTVCGAGVCIDSSVKDDAEGSYFVRIVDFVQFVKHAKVAIFVYELMECKPIATEEWMYQLEGAERADKFRSYNQAVVQFSRGEASEAREALGQADFSPDKITARMISRIEQYIATATDGDKTTSLQEIPLERSPTEPTPGQ